MDDEARYKESLQESLLASGWDEVFDHSKWHAWVKENRERLAILARVTVGADPRELEHDFAEVVEKFQPQTKFDLPTTEAIFRPLFADVEETARSIGLQPIRKVELITSTSISPSPLARPTTGIHQLFIGPGTSAFCNYWAKAFTAIVRSIADAGRPHERVTSLENLIQRTKLNPTGLVAAARLSLHYSIFGTVLGFGEYVQPSSYLAYRLQLLRAMEIFALAHEYAHFVAEERQLQFRERDGHSSDHALEFFCDELGLQISREWGERNESWLAFSGAGALVFFYAIEASLKCLRSLAAADGAVLRQDQAAANAGENTHPDSKSRADNLASLAVARTAEDQRDCVARFVGELVTICESVCSFVETTVSDTLNRNED